MNVKNTALLALTLATFAGTAMADTVTSWDWPRAMVYPGQDPLITDNVGHYEDIKATYNQTQGTMTWTGTFTRGTDGTFPTGIKIFMQNGIYPTPSAGELVNLSIDGRDMANSNVYAQAFITNGPVSLNIDGGKGVATNPGAPDTERNWLLSSNMTSTLTTRTFTFVIDTKAMAADAALAAGIDAAKNPLMFQEWLGLRFNLFGPNAQSYGTDLYQTALARGTTSISIPTPGAAALCGLGILAANRRRRAN
jgi:hypothetical protein